MLYLIGLGLWNEKDISLRGIEACKKCDYVYAELYTNKWGGSMDALEKIINKKITVLERSGMEEDSIKLVEKSKERDVAILVPGSPLFATTHIKIIREANEAGIKTDIIHSSSIQSAIAESGLSVYNFGKTVSIPVPMENYNPTSFYEEIVKNMSLGLHTLVLLDIEMSTQEGIKILLDIEKEKENKVITEDTKMIIISQIGSKHKKIKYDNVDALEKESFPAPAVLLIPGKLHFMEKEYLQLFDSKPSEKN